MNKWVAILFKVTMEFSTVFVEKVNSHGGFSIFCARESSKRVADCTVNKTYQTSKKAQKTHRKIRDTYYNIPP